MNFNPINYIRNKCKLTKTEMMNLLDLNLPMYRAMQMGQIKITQEVYNTLVDIAGRLTYDANKTKELRISRGLSYKQAANLLQLTVRQIKYLENPYAKSISLSLRRNINLYLTEPHRPYSKRGVGNIRRKLKLSNNDMAKLIGIAPSTWFAYERGQYQPRSVKDFYIALEKHFSYNELYDLMTRSYKEIYGYSKRQQTRNSQRH